MKNKQIVKVGIIKTLCYAEVFDFPLKRSELWRYFIGKKKVSKEEIRACLFEMVGDGVVRKTNNMYYLLGKRRLVVERAKRQIYSREKMKIAKKIIHKLSMIPTVKLIGISGSLSMNNCKKTDDIDLFIISSKNSLWITRFMVFAFLKVLKAQRGRKEKLAVDKICTNMYMSKDSLLLDRKNIFTAHEVLQMKVLVDKDNTYNDFLKKNEWIHNYLPNSYVKKKIYKKNSGTLSEVLYPIDSLFYKLQFLYMKKHITNEKIEPKMARFHPEDKTKYVLSLFRMKCNIYLKKDFQERNINIENATASLNTPGY